MEILKIKRSKVEGSTLKVYGSVLGDKGLIYKVAYFRGPLRRGWICSCDNFVMSKAAKNRNCKHIKLVRGTYGRYGSQVPKAV